jgi:hypothetical protein
MWDQAIGCLKFLHIGKQDLDTEQDFRNSLPHPVVVQLRVNVPFAPAQQANTIAPSHQ